jgi:hypothetical protein
MPIEDMIDLCCALGTARKIARLAFKFAGGAGRSGIGAIYIF